MRKIIMCGYMFCSFHTLKAQVGINTSSPKATLDVSLPAGYVSGDKAGLSIPLLTGDQIEAINTTDIKSGTLVYSTMPSNATVKDVFSSGYWFWKNASAKWEPISSNAPAFFYSPSILVITDTANPNFGTIDLYNNYKNQFFSPMVSSVGQQGAYLLIIMANWNTM